MYDFLSAYTLQRDVGDTYEYSNLGMGLLGHILSLKVGMDYEQLIIERICQVLEMEDTVITLTAAMKERLARGHNPVGLGWHIRDNGKTQIIWHNGGTGGYRTFCGFIKYKKVGTVVLSNMNIGADDIGFHLLDNSYKLKKFE
jgi:CubicO group peptidase (beta-lactamase class C family)